ncbi:MAG TPA: Lrp/AsnC family transcriptional regulator [Myxococcales bacterium]|jgi:Lrp/AsnC family leucine-responsive transcriptional regulator|nr:Lrp/AsnC family transcriptional regulator [Myxococcales bacterium]
MDPIDYQILDLLQRDARTTQVEIAEAVGLSQPSVADRIRKLDQGGAVLGYVARLDPRRMGNDIRAFIGVRISHPRHHDAFTRRIQQIGEVQECHRVAGLDSYLLKVVSRNTETLDHLISNVLRRIAGVTRTTTTIVLASVKETTAVPLQETEAAPRRRKEAAG